MATSNSSFGSRHGTRPGLATNQRAFSIALLGLSLFVQSTLFVQSALASPVFELFGDTLGSGGLTARSGSPGAASTYFNPSLLPLMHGGEVAGGVLVVEQSIGIDLGTRVQANDVSTERATSMPSSGLDIGSDRSYPFGAMPTTYIVDGCNAPSTDGVLLDNGRETCGRGRPAVPRQSRGTGHGTLVYTPIGLVYPIIADRLVFGFYGIMGQDVSQHSFHADENEAVFTNSLHPELYSDRMAAPTIAFGFGSLITDWLSVGLSFGLKISTSAQSDQFVVDNLDQDATLKLTVRNETKVDMAPNFGVTLLPNESTTVSATVHTEQSFSLGFRFYPNLPDGDRQEAERQLVHHFVPLQIGLGGAHEIAMEDDRVLSITAGLKWAKWSDYLDRNGVNPSGIIHYVEGSASQTHDLGWRNTMTPALGLRHSHHGTITFLDARYVPTPIPEQKGRTNYVGNNRTDLVAGLTHEFTVAGMIFRAGLNLRGSLLHRRVNTKIPQDTNNDGVPDTDDPDAIDPLRVRDEFPDGSVDKTSETVVATSQGLQTNNPGWPSFASRGFLRGGGLSLSLLY